MACVLYPVGRIGGSVKIMTLNCNGLRSALRRGFLEFVARDAPDVLCLQEVRADAASLPAEVLQPLGWTCAWAFAEKKGYAGTAVWVRGHAATFTVGTGHARGDAEGRVVGAHLADVDVWSVYLPSGSSGPERQAWKFEYLDHVAPWMDRLRASGRPQVLCGDLNIAHTPMDIRNARQNEKNSGFLPEERAWIGARLQAGWQDAFRVANPQRVAYSWWSNRGNARANDVGWRIDYILCAGPVRVRRSDIVRDAGLADHAPVSAELAFG
jgi:exodeoxyribonuclease-3